MTAPQPKQTHIYPHHATKTVCVKGVLKKRERKEKGGGKREKGGKGNRNR